MNPYIISTERLGLRRWIESDIKPFTEMNKDPEVMKYFPKILTNTETLEMVERINLHFEKNDFGYYAVENKLTKQFIGFTGLGIPTFEFSFTPCFEIGWRYRKEVWGQGFATEAANACLQYGFQTLQFDKILSWTATINLNSEKVMQRIGMTKIGEFDHPKIEPTSVLSKHVLYEIKNSHNKSLSY